MTNKPLKYFSTFTGIGGFELGILRAYELYNSKIARLERKQNPKDIQKIQPDNKGKHGGQSPTCIGYSEIDKYACQIYSKHFPDHKNYGDITKINPAELPDFDIMVGGFPCQAFSIAGKRKGFSDTRGTLFFEIVKIIREKQPRFLLLENVKGLLFHDQGSTFYTIIATLDELGYDIQWQVLNSKNHGVPQNRERVFIIGHLRGTPRPEVFPITTYAKSYLKEITKGVSQEKRVYEKTGISPALDTMGGGNKQPKVIQPVLTPDRINKRQDGRRFKENGDPAFTVTAQDRHGVYNGEKIRRLTPVECERLQGFPDGWTEGVSDTQRYKTLGNAVTVNVITNIITKLLYDK